MALSLESLLANRRAKKTAPIRRLIDNNSTDNSLVNPQVNTITNNHDTSSNVTHNISNSSQSPNVTPARKRSRRKTKPANIQLDNSSVLLTFLVILYLLTRHLFFHVDLHSVPHLDILTGRKFQLTSTIFPDACD